MISTVKDYIKRQILPAAKDKNAVEAYDIWAESYNSQPGNLMLDLDEKIFAMLLKDVVIENKNIADIGCGTGRHWAQIFRQSPANLTGFDVSPGMLKKLNEKFPGFETHVINDNRFSAIADHTYDVILSTLTVAHIENIEEALETWCRITREKGDIIITDFHPNALASGGKRTFKHQNKYIAVQNFVHNTGAITQIMARHGFYVAAGQEIKVDETVKDYYLEQNALHVYKKFEDQPIIYGIHFKRI